MATTHRNALRRRWASLSEAVSSRLWPVPLAAILVAVLFGIALPVLDRAIDPDLAASAKGLLFSGGTDSARAVLSAIAGSLITVTSLTFSLTVVALQLASSQASPRLLRLFASDPMVHATLAMFLGTFAYALTVLRTVSDADATPFVPRLAVTVASVLTLASVIVLTFFLAHLARQLRVETMLRDVHEEAERTIALLAGVDQRHAPMPPAPESPRVVLVPRSGFVTAIDRDSVLDFAAEHDLVVRELRAVGSSAIAGTPLAEWWPRTGRASGASPGAGRALDEDDLAASAQRRIASAYAVGYERTSAQDLGYGLRQLADIATRALSPGINDPTTAVHALSHISAVLADLAKLPPAPDALADEHGIARLVPIGGRFEDLLEVALQQPRRYGAGDPAVAERMLLLIEEVAWNAPGVAARDALASQLERLEAAVAVASYDDAEVEWFAELGRRARGTLDRSPT